MFVQNAYSLELHFHTFIIICVHEIENVEINKLLIKYCIYISLHIWKFVNVFISDEVPNIIHTITG